MSPSTHHVFLALSQPTLGREDEFHSWYDAHHLQDVVDHAPGFVRGRRYFAMPEQVGGARLKWESLAVYNLETEDMAALHVNVRANVGKFTPSNGVFEADHTAWVYTPAGPSKAVPEWAAQPHDAASQPPRLLALAFGDEPVALDAVGSVAGIVRGHQFVRHADQREGCSPPWQHVSFFEIQSDHPGEAAKMLADVTGAAALWVYQPRGVDHTTGKKA